MQTRFSDPNDLISVSPDSTPFFAYYVSVMLMFLQFTNVYFFIKK